MALYTLVVSWAILKVRPGGGGPSLIMRASLHACMHGAQKPGGRYGGGGAAGWYTLRWMCPMPQVALLHHPPP